MQYSFDDLPLSRQNFFDMLRIYLARHGQDEDNANGILNGQRDLPLTEKGIAQAHEVAERMKARGMQFDAIYVSPLQRAFRTASIIAETVGHTPPQILPELIERNFGVMTGVPIREIVERCAPDILQGELVAYFLNPEGAETFPQLIERATQMLAALQKKHPDGTILLVSHGDYGKMIYAAYYHLDWKEVLKMFHFGNSELLELSPDSSAESAHVFTIAQYNV